MDCVRDYNERMDTDNYAESGYFQMTIFDLRHDVDRDVWELGIRVASAFYAENETDPENFIRILTLRHRLWR